MERILQIDGMNCGKCAARVETALQGVEGVDSAKVDLAAKSARVSYDASRATAAQLTSAVTEAGYTVAGVRSVE